MYSLPSKNNFCDTLWTLFKERLQGQNLKNDVALNISWLQVKKFFNIHNSIDWTAEGEICEGIYKVV